MYKENFSGFCLHATNALHVHILRFKANIEKVEAKRFPQV
jgi:hypothetical protein